MRSREILISTPRGTRKIGDGHSCFVVAEISGNHNQNFGIAKQLIEAASDAGADAVKIQTYTADTMTIPCDNVYFRVPQGTNSIWDGKNLYNLYQRAYTPWEWHAPLKKIAEDRGLAFFSTPFDKTSVDFLESLNMPCYKIASYEATDEILLTRIAQTKKPIFLSVGFCTQEEIDRSIKVLRSNGAEEIAVLYCLTSYSSDARQEASNLATVRDIAERFNVVAGFSDNNSGIKAPYLASFMGAAIIEKHIKLEHDNGSIDASFSLEPRDFREMVVMIRGGEQARGRVCYGCQNESEKTNKRFRRSLFVVEDMKKGDIFSEKNIRSIRPGFGLPTRFYEEILGKRAAKNIQYGTPLQWDLIE